MEIDLKNETLMRSVFYLLVDLPSDFVSYLHYEIFKTWLLSLQ